MHDRLDIHSNKKSFSLDGNYGSYEFLRSNWAEMSCDNSSKKWHFYASGQSIGKRSSVPETRRPGLLPSINNSRNPALLKN